LELEAEFATEDKMLKNSISHFAEIRLLNTSCGQCIQQLLHPDFHGTPEMSLRAGGIPVEAAGTAIEFLFYFHNMAGV
jgi:hypothetical protein